MDASISQSSSQSISQSISQSNGHLAEDEEHDRRVEEHEQFLLASSPDIDALLAEDTEYNRRDEAILHRESRDARLRDVAASPPLQHLVLEQPRSRRPRSRRPLRRPPHLRRPSRRPLHLRPTPPPWMQATAALVEPSQLPAALAHSLAGSASASNIGNINHSSASKSTSTPQHQLLPTHPAPHAPPHNPSSKRRATVCLQVRWLSAAGQPPAEPLHLELAPATVPLAAGSLAAVSLATGSLAAGSLATGSLATVSLATGAESFAHSLQQWAAHYS